MSENKQNSSRRQFLKKAAYTAPVILTLSVNPSLASAGSGLASESGEKEHYSQYDDKKGSRVLSKKRKHRRRSLGERFIGFVVKLFG